MTTPVSPAACGLVTPTNLAPGSVTWTRSGHKRRKQAKGASCGRSRGRSSLMRSLVKKRSKGREIF